MNKLKKYVKPSSRSLAGLLGAEGYCQNTGLSAYGTACSPGIGNDGACGNGTGPTGDIVEAFCWPGGQGAAQCLANGLGAFGQ